MQVWVNSILSVLFYPQRDIPNKADFVARFSDFARVFDGDPLMLPISNAPPHVPRIVLKSRDGSYTCEVALDRLNFQYVDTQNRKRDLGVIYPEYRQILDRVVAGALSGISSPINRLGFVTRHIVETGESAAEWFRRIYLKADAIPPTFEAHLNLLHKLDLESMPVNRWLKIRTLRDQQNPERDPAIGVEIDINTIPGAPPQTFDRSAIMAFYLESFDRAEKDRQAYVLDPIAPEEG